MLTTHLAFLPAAASRGPRRQFGRLLRRLAACVGRRLRPPAPPAWTLSDHLRRDIGIDPLSEFGRWRHWR